MMEVKQTSRRKRKKEEKRRIDLRIELEGFGPISKGEIALIRKMDKERIMVRGKRYEIIHGRCGISFSDNILSTHAL